MTTDLSETEAVKVAAFGFDTRPTIAEMADLLSLRAAYMAQLTAEIAGMKLAQLDALTIRPEVKS